MKKKTSKEDLKAMSAKNHPADTQAAETASFSPWTTEALDSEELEELEELTLPPIVKIADMPIGASLDFTLVKVVPSRNPSIDSPLIIAALTKGGNKITVPAVAALANVLLPGFDKKKHRDDPQAICPHVGKRIIVRKSAIRESSKWTTDDGSKRKFPVFDVFVK